MAFLDPLIEFVKYLRRFECRKLYAFFSEVFKFTEREPIGYSQRFAMEIVFTNKNVYFCKETFLFVEILCFNK
jgi:hypothetical protein